MCMAACVWVCRSAERDVNIYLLTQYSEEELVALSSSLRVTGCTPVPAS
jgi:hypothetical protein